MILFVVGTYSVLGFLVLGSSFIDTPFGYIHMLIIPFKMPDPSNARVSGDAGPVAFNFVNKLISHNIDSEIWLGDFD